MRHPGSVKTKSDCPDVLRQRYEALRFPHHLPILVLHHGRSAGDDGNEGKDGAEGEGRYTGDGLADRTAHRQYAADTHQHGADGMVAEIAGGGEPFNAELRQSNDQSREPTITPDSAMMPKLMSEVSAGLIK